MSYFQPDNKANYNQPTVQPSGGNQQGNYAYEQKTYQQPQQPYPPQQNYNQAPPQYYQQPPQYYQGQPVQYQQPIYQQPVIITSQVVRPQVFVVPIGTGNVCPYCQREYISIKRKRIGTGTIIAVILLLLIFWPLFWLPFVMDDCKETYYACNNCGKVI